eukprot:scaffold38599_cov75-Phaeocystis_antarctica.AAC.1
MAATPHPWRRTDPGGGRLGAHPPPSPYHARPRPSARAHETLFSLLGAPAPSLLRAAAKDLPEAQRLVRSRRDDRRAVWALREVEDARGVAGELGGLDHVRVLPQDELVVREAVRRDDLLVVHRPLQRADLRVGVDGVDEGAVVRVPKADHAVGRAAARGEQVLLPRAPREGLDRRVVLVEAKDGRRCRHAPLVPNIQQVVVAPRGELHTAWGPLEPADLLLVSVQRRHRVLRL